MKINFKKWIENQVLGGGLEPPKEEPIRYATAMPTYDLLPKKLIKKISKKKLRGTSTS